MGCDAIQSETEPTVQHHKQAGQMAAGDLFQGEQKIGVINIYKKMSSNKIKYIFHWLLSFDGNKCLSIGTVA